ncbi:MAG: hypothetical protein R8G66_12205 [Cytophagales bacterium]|nr:hypothetical protein [Cytophagales bacterium]
MKTSLIFIITLCLSFSVVARQWVNQSGDAILSTGNVGIGTNSPLSKLHLNGNFRITDPNTSNTVFILQNNLGIGEMLVRNQTSPQIKLSAASDSYFLGGLGIGNASPNAKLHVFGTFKVADPNTGNDMLNMTFPNGSGELYLRNGSAARVKLAATGDSYFLGGGLGIGNVSPNAKLHVFGTFKVADPNTGNDMLNMTFPNGSGELLLRNGSAARVKLAATGDSYFLGGGLGIGNASPNAKLHVFGTFKVADPNTGNDVLNMTFPNGSGELFLRDGSSAKIKFAATGDSYLLGNLGIGTSSPDHELSVKGTINAEELILEDVDGADFVFEEDYDLRSLEETEQFIKANKHLPEVPSAAEMAEEGLALKEMNILLLQKVEELTLHLIRQEKAMAAQANKITAQAEKMEKMEQELTALKVTQTKN